MNDGWDETRYRKRRPVKHKTPRQIQDKIKSLEKDRDRWLRWAEEDEKRGRPIFSSDMYRREVARCEKEILELQAKVA